MIAALPGASVSPDEVGQASGISNMARYIGGSLAVAAAATVSTAVTNTHREAGSPATDALAAGLSRASLLLTIMSLAGTALALLVRHDRAVRARGSDRAAAAATAHTIPTHPRPAREPRTQNDHRGGPSRSRQPVDEALGPTSAGL